MANPWFKFYGGEYLSDPKIFKLTSDERSCWLTLLCLASMSSKQGKIPFINVEQIMVQSGINPDSWDKNKGLLEKLEELKMITNDNATIFITHWKKRQNSNLTGYERVKRYREKQKKLNVINDNAMITSEESSIEESTTTKQNSLLTTDKIQHSEKDWIKILRSWKSSGNRVIDNKKLVIKKNKSRWLVDKNGTWKVYNLINK